MEGGGGKIHAVLSPKLVQGAMVFFAILFAAGYIVTLHAAAARSYTLQEATQRQTELQREQDRLLSEVDRLRSLSSVRSRQVFLGLTPVQNVVFLSSHNENVAFVSR